MALFTPVNQVRMTNVSIVRLKKGGKRFELACYPNKVTPWRNKIETDLDEVLQSEILFMNVSKGIVAKKEDLTKCFQTEDMKEAILEVLKKGEIQVSEKERHQMNEKLFRDIATVVAEKCVNPDTKRPLTVSVVEKAMKDIHYSVIEKRNAKQQALEVIRLLKGKIPIQRAQMRLKVVGSGAEAKKLYSKLQPIAQSTEKEEITEEKLSVVILIDPGSFRDLDELVRKFGGSIEVMSVSVHEEGEQNIDNLEDKPKTTATKKAEVKKRR